MNLENNYTYKFLAWCLKLCKFFGWFCFIFLFELVPYLLLEYLGINTANLSTTNTYLITFLSDIIVLSTLLIVYFPKLKKDFTSYFKNFSENLEFSLKWWLIGIIVMIISNYILLFLSGGKIAANESSVREIIKNVPLLAFFMVSIYAPFTEEFLFRKLFKDLVSNKYLYVILSGLIFGGMHILSSLTADFSFLDLLYIIPYSSLGIAFAYTYYKSNNIFSTIVMHSLHNTLSFIFLIGSSLL